MVRPACDLKNKDFQGTGESRMEQLPSRPLRNDLVIKLESFGRVGLELIAELGSSFPKWLIVKHDRIEFT